MSVHWTAPAVDTATYSRLEMDYGGADGGQFVRPCKLLPARGADQRFADFTGRTEHVGSYGRHHQHYQQQHLYHYSSNAIAAEHHTPSYSHQHHQHPDSHSYGPSTPVFFHAAGPITGLSSTPLSSYYSNQNSPSRLLSLSHDFYDNSNIRSTRSNSYDAVSYDKGDEYDAYQSRPNPYEYHQPSYTAYQYSVQYPPSEQAEYSPDPYMLQRLPALSVSQSPRAYTARSSISDVNEIEPLDHVRYAAEFAIHPPIIRSPLNTTFDGRLRIEDDEISSISEDDTEEVRDAAAAAGDRDNLDPALRAREGTLESEPAVEKHSPETSALPMGPTSPDANFSNAKEALRQRCAEQKRRQHERAAGCHSPDPPPPVQLQPSPARTIYNATQVSATRRQTRNSISAASNSILATYSPRHSSYPYGIPSELYDDDDDQVFVEHLRYSPLNSHSRSGSTASKKSVDGGSSNSSFASASADSHSRRSNSHGNSGWTTPDSTDNEYDDNYEPDKETNKVVAKSRRRESARTRTTKSSSASVSSVGPIRTARQRSLSAQPRVQRKLDDPVPVPNLTKKSRGRAVPTTPFIIEQGITKQLRLYTCTVEGCGTYLWSAFSPN